MRTRTYKKKDILNYLNYKILYNYYTHKSNIIKIVVLKSEIRHCVDFDNDISHVIYYKVKKLNTLTGTLFSKAFWVCEDDISKIIN